MPIDFNETLKKTTQWAFGSPLLNSILGSGLFMAIVISLIMVIIVMLVYPAKNGAQFKPIAKMFIYMFIGTVFLMFLHDGILKHTIEEEISRKEIDNLSFGVQRRQVNPAYSGAHQQITPFHMNTTGGNIQKVEPSNILKNNTSNITEVPGKNNSEAEKEDALEIDNIISGLSAKYSEGGADDADDADDNIFGAGEPVNLFE